MSINKVMLSGNLTRDPEVRATPSGSTVMQFSIAVNERRKNNQTGEYDDYPNYIDCTMFGTRAEAVSRYISKGSKVAIEGHIRQQRWEKDGQKRSKIGVIVDEIEFMSRNEQSAQPVQPAYTAPVTVTPEVMPTSIYDDLPF